MAEKPQQLSGSSGQIPKIHWTFLYQIQQKWKYLQNKWLSPHVEQDVCYISFLPIFRVNLSVTKSIKVLQCAQDVYRPADIILICFWRSDESSWAGTCFWVSAVAHNQRVYRFLLIWFKYGVKLQFLQAKDVCVWVCACNSTGLLCEKKCVLQVWNSVHY